MDQQELCQNEKSSGDYTELYAEDSFGIDDTLLAYEAAMPSFLSQTTRNSSYNRSQRYDEDKKDFKGEDMPAWDANENLNKSHCAFGEDHSAILLPPDDPGPILDSSALNFTITPAKYSASRSRSGSSAKAWRQCKANAQGPQLPAWPEEKDSPLMMPEADPQTGKISPTSSPPVQGSAKPLQGTKRISASTLFFESQILDGSTILGNETVTFESPPPPEESNNQVVNTDGESSSRIYPRLVSGAAVVPVSGLKSSPLSPRTMDFSIQDFEETPERMGPEMKASVVSPEHASATAVRILPNYELSNQGAAERRVTMVADSDEEDRATEASGMDSLPVSYAGHGLCFDDNDSQGLGLDEEEEASGEIDSDLAHELTGLDLDVPTIEPTRISPTRHLNLKNGEPKTPTGTNTSPTIRDSSISNTAGKNGPQAFRVTPQVQKQGHPFVTAGRKMQSANCRKKPLDINAMDAANKENQSPHSLLKDANQNLIMSIDLQGDNIALRETVKAAHGRLVKSSGPDTLSPSKLEEKFSLSLRIDENKPVLGNKAGPSLESESPGIFSPSVVFGDLNDKHIEEVQPKAWRPNAPVNSAATDQQVVTGVAQTAGVGPSGALAEPKSHHRHHPVLGDEWKCAQTDSGRTYYYNRRTRESQWRMPKDAVVLKMPNGKERIFAPPNKKGKNKLPKHERTLEGKKTKALSSSAQLKAAKSHPEHEYNDSETQTEMLNTTHHEVSNLQSYWESKIVEYDKTIQELRQPTLDDSAHEQIPSRESQQQEGAFLEDPTDHRVGRKLFQSVEEIAYLSEQKAKQGVEIYCPFCGVGLKLQAVEPHVKQCMAGSGQAQIEIQHALMHTLQTIQLRHSNSLDTRRLENTKSEHREELPRTYSSPEQIFHHFVPISEEQEKPLKRKNQRHDPSVETYHPSVEPIPQQHFLLKPNLKAPQTPESLQSPVLVGDRNHRSSEDPSRSKATSPCTSPSKHTFRNQRSPSFVSQEYSSPAKPRPDPYPSTPSPSNLARPRTAPSSTQESQLVSNIRMEFHSPNTPRSNLSMNEQGGTFERLNQTFAMGSVPDLGEADRHGAHIPEAPPLVGVFDRNLPSAAYRRNPMEQCPDCGRTFARGRLEAHVKVCKRVFLEQRPQFDAAGQWRKNTALDFDPSGHKWDILLASSSKQRQKKRPANSNVGTTVRPTTPNPVQARNLSANPAATTGKKITSKPILPDERPLIQPSGSQVLQCFSCLAAVFHTRDDLLVHMRSCLLQHGTSNEHLNDQGKVVLPSDVNMTVMVPESHEVLMQMTQGPRATRQGTDGQPKTLVGSMRSHCPFCNKTLANAAISGHFLKCKQLKTIRSKRARAANPKYATQHRLCPQCKKQVPVKDLKDHFQKCKASSGSSVNKVFKS